MGSTTIEVASKYWGPINWTYLGTVDLRLSESIASEPWFSKYHPIKWFHGFLWQVEADSILVAGSLTCVAWDVWVPIRTDNKGWKPHPDSEYAKKNHKAWRHAFGYTDFRINRWLKESQHLLKSVPEEALARAKEKRDGKNSSQNLA